MDLNQNQQHKTGCTCRAHVRPAGVPEWRYRAQAQTQSRGYVAVQASAGGRVAVL